MRSLALCLLLTGCANWPPPPSPEFRAEIHCEQSAGTPSSMAKARRTEVEACMARLGYARVRGQGWVRTKDAERAREVDGVVESGP